MSKPPPAPIASPRQARGSQDGGLQALARANTRWEEYQTAQSNAGTAESTNARLQSQADSLPADDPGAGAADTAASDSASALTAALGLADDARSDLEASKTEWGDLRDDESDRNSETAGELDDIELRRPVSA